MSVAAFKLVNADKNPPREVKIRPAIQVQLILEHRIDGVCVDALLWDLELGDLFVSGIARRVWRALALEAVGESQVVSDWIVAPVELTDKLIGVDLQQYQLLLPRNMENLQLSIKLTCFARGILNELFLLDFQLGIKVEGASYRSVRN